VSKHIEISLTQVGVRKLVIYSVLLVAIPEKHLEQSLQRFLRHAHGFAYPGKYMSISQSDVSNELNNFIGVIELGLSQIRKNLFISNWKELAEIKPIDLTNLPRKKYVTAREEITKAKEILKEDPEDVMMHLRNAIDLSIKERFGFKKILFMKTFIDEAKKYDFPLPSYDFIYQLFLKAVKEYIKVKFIHHLRYRRPLEQSAISLMNWKP
jgi:hypothetical protein